MDASLPVNPAWIRIELCGPSAVASIEPPTRKLTGREQPPSPLPGIYVGEAGAEKYSPLLALHEAPCQHSQCIGAAHLHIF